MIETTHKLIDSICFSKVFSELYPELLSESARLDGYPQSDIVFLLSYRSHVARVGTLFRKITEF